ncbi:Hachiman antiphage defense system protein HamA [Bacillus haimaensis]|uniref:Hachiman antiphage defense system protein HamA n=1 Tax=Bacillus haimaensis TaxID=3160967 RepID=UPI003AA8A6AD
MTKTDEKELTIHSTMIGEHPNSSHFFGEWLSCDDIPVDMDKKDKIHRKLLEVEGNRELAVEKLSKLIINHHIDDDRISRLEEKKKILSKYEFNEVLKTQQLLPVMDTTKKGNATEILLAEYLQSTSNLLLLLYRLRYNPNVNQSMKGDDVLLFNTNNLTEKVIIGEAKFRTEPAKTVIEEITKEFGKALTKPLSVTFVASMLNLGGDKETSAKLEDLNIEIVKDNVPLINVGLILSNHNTYRHVERNLSSSNPNFIMLSLSLQEPSKFIEDSYNLSHQILEGDEDE